MRSRLLAAVLAPLVAAGCASPAPLARDQSAGQADGDHPSRLEVAAVPPAAAAADPADLAPGVRPLAVSAPDREVLVHVPPGVTAQTPATLVLALHGAGGDARGGLAPLAPHADAARLLVVAPSSAGGTWDAIGGRWGRDVELIDAALQEARERWPVVPDRLVTAGFSDGASYALGLGLANGDLVTHVVALSPGFVPRAPRTGRPVVFVTHGTADDVLPIDRTSRRIVPDLRDQGYQVQYREFDGGHVVPPDLAAEAVAWATG